jgi:hypothetical protein
LISNGNSRRLDLLCNKVALRFGAANIRDDHVTRRRRGTSAHIAPIALLLLELMSVEEEDSRRNRRPAGQSALIRCGASEVVIRLAAGRHPAAASAL